MAVRVKSCGLFAAVLVCFASVAAGQVSGAERRLLVFENADYAGFDYETRQNIDLDGCKKACLDDPACKAFTYNQAAQWCFLKSDFGRLATFEGAVAGRVAAGAATSGDQDMLDLSFLPEGIAEEASRLKRAVERTRPGGDEGHTGAVNAAASAMATGNARAAAQSLRSALALDPDAFAAWLSLARALVAIEPADYSERYDLPEQASAAAFIAVGLAASDEERALALAVLGQMLERREIWRPAIESFKASLRLAERESVRADFERLRAERGFRMIDYSVDADAEAPRACVQFSETFADGNIEVADYVTLDGARPGAVTREAQELCIDGLEHGERYRLGLRAGLPSAVGETLLEDVELSFYVRDRAPSVRFTGRSYVLPRAGAKGLPLVSVNTRLVEAEIARIGGRALAETLRDGNFLDQISGYGVDDIVERRGERLWQGEMPVAMDLNREVVTAFPVDELLGDPAPGVYVLTARASESAQEHWDERATQWFIVTDLGLATLKGDDGLHVFARSLATARPLAGIEVSLVAVGNDVLGRARTDDSGYVLFAPGLVRGTGGMAPALAIAEGGGDAAFIDLTEQPFDLTDRGVAGRPAPEAIDVFAYTERGVYRPGESVHLVALARDSAASAIDAPLTIVVERPDGVEFRRVTSTAPEIGGHALDIDLDDGALTGTWRARAYGDPLAAALAEARFLVEDFVPERLDFDIDTPLTSVRAAAPVPITLEGRYLYGAPAVDVGIEGDVTVRPADAAPGPLARYRFGIADEQVVPARETLGDLPRTDAGGHAGFDVRLPQLPQATGLLVADIALRLREAGGRAVERRTTLPVRPDNPLIGVRPLFDGDAVEERSVAGFEVIGVSPDLERADLGPAQWELVRLERSYEWYRYDGEWNYEAVTRTSRIANGEIALAADATARIDVPVDWGRYRLEVKSAGTPGTVTSIEFSAGWYAADAAAETPDILEVSLDRPSYRAGATAAVRLVPRFAGTALVTVVAERVLAMRAVEVGAEGTTVEFPVDESWGAGAYVTAMLYRPMDVEAGQNPARAVGIDWLAADTAAREIDVGLEVPEFAEPRSTLTVPVSLGGLAPGEAARVTLAAVDVGILNLTGYEAPEPESWYYGQRGLGIEIRDIYGRLINGLQGTRGQVRSGGDESGLSMTGTPPSEAPVALFSGIVAADAHGQADVAFDIPAFNGTLRLMAVAWSASRVGHASADLVVRDPVVVTASLPRFLAPGDRSRMWLDIDNVSGPAGTWSLAVELDGPVASAASGVRQIELGAGERRAVSLPLEATATGAATVALNLSHDSGMTIARSFDLGVRPAQLAVTRRSVQTLAAGSGRLTVTPDLVGDLVPGSAVVTLAARRGLLLDVPALLDELDRYPYGCAEQITSRALPLVYLNDVARGLGIAADTELDQRIGEAITRVLQRQGANGSFGLWWAGGDDLWLDAYVSDFLTRAREAGHTVPSRAFEQALDRLENELAYRSQSSGVGEDVAYAFYVLARNRRASIGDLRYYADAHLDEFTTPLARAQLGAALSLYGEGERAATAFGSALAELQDEEADETGWREDYGSELRDSAATLTLVAESRATGIALPAIARVVERERLERRYASTQENAWMLLAAHALDSDDDDIVVTVDGTGHRGRLMRRLTDEAVRSGPLVIANEGETDFQAVVTVSGVPIQPEPATANGLRVRRSMHTLDGEPVAGDVVAQNERLVVVLTIEETAARRARLLVEDYLPAGLEIDNPRLVAGGDTGSLAWLGETSSPAHVEFRDDRFAAAFDRSGSAAETLTLAYIVRAVTPGHYVHPPVVVEDMYARDVNARTALGTIEVVGPEPR